MDKWDKLRSGGVFFFMGIASLEMMASLAQENNKRNNTGKMVNIFFI